MTLPVTAVMVVLALNLHGYHQVWAQNPPIDDAWRHLANPARTAAILGGRIPGDHYAPVVGHQQSRFVGLLETKVWLPVEPGDVGILTGGKLVAAAGQHAYVVRALSLQQPFTGGYALYFADHALAVTYQALGNSPTLKREALIVLLPEPLLELYVWYGASQ